MVNVEIALWLAGCRGKDQTPKPEGVVALSSPTSDGQLDPAMEPKPGGPKLGAVHLAAPIHIKPDRRSRKLGYLRAGGTVVRGEKPVLLDDCEGGWFRVLPVGYVCAAHEATTVLVAHAEPPPPRTVLSTAAPWRGPEH